MDFKEIEKQELKELLQKNSDIIIKLTEQLEKIKDQNKELIEENKTWQLVSNSDDLIDMSEVAKVLNYKKYGRNKLFELLRDLEILRYNNQPYQKYVDEGYFKIIEQKIDLEFSVKINLKTVATQRGLDYIRRQLDEYTNK